MVVGAGLAGLRAVEALRGGGVAGEVVVVGAEPWPPYNRPPVSKQALAAGAGIDDLRLRVRRSAADVDWRLGRRVVAADLDRREVELDSGELLAFDGLVVASGVRPRRLDIPGPTAGRYVLRTLDDATALHRLLRPGTRLLVVGAGFIGCEVSSTARSLGCDVTCVAIDPEPMAGPLGRLLGAELRRRHEADGVRFRLSTGVEAFVGADRVAGALLTDGSTVAADVVVEALGSVADVPWLGDLGDGDGVLTDNAMHVLDPDGAPLPGVVAAGDIARYPNPRFDDVPRRVEHWSNGTDTGRRAGATLAADLTGSAPPPPDWAPIPSFWSDQAGTTVQSFGLPGLGDEDGIRVVAGGPGSDLVAEYHRGADLVGVVGIGMTAQAMDRRDRVGRRA